MPYEDYEKLDVLGEGTFGVVTRARSSTGIVAIKKLRARALANGVDHATLREIMLLHELKHENVIDLSEVFVHNGALSLVFEFCSTDLERVLERARKENQPLTPGVTKACVQGTLRGLAYCHRNWVLHRDIKPGNLLISPSGEIKLADFGLARMFGSPKRKMTGQVITRWYRPPELLYGAKLYGPPIDLWSVGCVLAELITRTPLFPGSSDIDMLARIFTVFGAPTETSWPGVTSLPDFLNFDSPQKTPIAQARLPRSGPATTRARRAPSTRARHVMPRLRRCLARRAPRPCRFSRSCSRAAPLAGRPPRSVSPTPTSRSGPRPGRWRCCCLQLRRRAAPRGRGPLRSACRARRWWRGDAPEHEIREIRIRVQYS